MANNTNNNNGTNAANVIVSGATGPAGSYGYITITTASGHYSGIMGASGYGYTGNYVFEPSVESIVRELLYINHKEKDDGVRSYIVKFIKTYTKFDNLKKAVKDVCPKYEDMLDKLIPLK
jgi:hypothetical protein